MENFSGIDGNKVGFLEEEDEYKISSSHRETPSLLAGMDSRWTREAVPRN